MAQKKKAGKVAASAPLPEGFESVGFRWFKPEKPGDSIRGHFVGTFEMPERKVGRKTFEKQTAYQIAEFETGELVSVSGAALTRAFEQIEPDTEVFVRFDGYKELQGGGKVKLFTVAKRAGSVPKKRGKR